MKFNWEEIGEFGKKVADTLYEAADTVGKKTGEVVEVQKLKNQIYAMRRENAKDCLDIGRMVFAKYQGGGEIDEDYKELCQEMEEREKEILACEKKVAEMKGTEFCKACHAPVAEGMKYCPYCGEKIEQEEDIFEEEEEIFAEEELAEYVEELEGKEGEV